MTQSEPRFRGGGNWPLLGFDSAVGQVGIEIGSENDDLPAPARSADAVVWKCPGGAQAVDDGRAHAGIVGGLCDVEAIGHGYSLICCPVSRD